MGAAIYRVYADDGTMLLAGRDREDILAYARALAGEHTMHVIVTVATPISQHEWPVAGFACDDVAGGTRSGP
jgi:hypothetical protein